MNHYVNLLTLNFIARVVLQRRELCTSKDRLIGHVNYMFYSMLDEDIECVDDDDDDDDDNNDDYRNDES